MRNIYGDVAPTEGTGERYTKFKQNVEDTLEKLEPDKNGRILMKILDLNGNIITPGVCDPRYQIGSNTLNTTRAITMEDSDRWRIDHTQSAGEVVGKKPGEH
jgi:hypothetical protein